MEKPRVILGVRGAELMFYGGYCYRKRRGRAAKLIRWRCSHFTLFSCKGAMTTDMTYINPRALEEHNHPPNEAELETTLLRLKMRDLVGSSTGSLKAVVRSVLEEASPAARTLLESNLVNIKRYLRRIRQLQQQPAGAATTQSITSPQVQGSRTHAGGTVAEVLPPQNTGVIPLHGNTDGSDVEAESGVTKTVLSTLPTSIIQRVTKEELPEVKQEELVLVEDEYKYCDSSIMLPPEERVSWETTSVGIGEGPNVSRTIEEVVKSPFETVFCSETFPEVKLEAEDNDNNEPMMGFISHPKEDIEFVDSGGEPDTTYKVEIEIDKGVTVLQSEETEMLDGCSFTKSSVLIVNHNTSKRPHDSTDLNATRKRSPIDFKVCQICKNEIFSTNEQLTDHYKLRHHTLPSFTMEAAKKDGATPRMSETITKNQTLPLNKPLEKISHPTNKVSTDMYLPTNKVSADFSLPTNKVSADISLTKNTTGHISDTRDGWDVFHVISLKRIPEKRRKATREKIAELLDLIVSQDLDPKLLDLSKLNL